MKAYQEHTIANVNASLASTREAASAAGRPQVDESDPCVRLNLALGKLQCAELARERGEWQDAARLEME
jgi:hypothetical protein